jgi:hydrogenase nickel incorporation protein HypA/HybF
MHEFSLINGLMTRITQAAKDNGGHRIIAVRVRLGALSNISPEHFREHFALAALGTPASQARLEIVQDDDASDLHAQDVLLESVTLED